MNQYKTTFKYSYFKTNGQKVDGGERFYQGWFRDLPSAKYLHIQMFESVEPNATNVERDTVEVK